MERFELSEGEAALLRDLRSGGARSSRTTSGSLRADRNPEDSANEDAAHERRVRVYAAPDQNAIAQVGFEAPHTQLTTPGLEPSTTRLSMKPNRVP
jgi:hypothetical protein